MDNYIFSADRQLIFYVNIGGRSSLVQFGSRNINGASVFQTSNEKTAEAIRRHSLYKRGVIVEQTVVEQTVTPSATVPYPNETTHNGEVTMSGDSTGTTSEDAETIEAKNFTQAKSLLAKRLNIRYNDIKSPDQLQKLAKDAGIIIKY